MGTLLLFAFMISPLIVSIILMIRKNTDSMFYMKYIGLAVGFFNLIFLFGSNGESIDGGAIYTITFYVFIVFPVNGIAFFTCLFIDLSASNNASQEENITAHKD